MTDERQPHPKEEQKRFSEERASLLKITFGPTIWAAHFLACYCLLAVTCAKGWNPGPVRDGLLVVSVAALAGVLWVGWRAWRQWNVRETGDFVNRRGKPEDRHHFLGHAAFLLSVISFIGVVFVSLPLILLEGCG